MGAREPRAEPGEMLVTAGEVRESCSGTQYVESSVKTILRTFHSEIMEAGKSGATSVIVSVPTNFSIVNMNNKTAQTIIYHRLIEALEKKGFNVRISMDNAVVTYCIRWDIKSDVKDLQQMREVIAAHIVRDGGGGE